MALFGSEFVEVVFLYRSQRDGINRGDSSDQLVLFFIFGFVWSVKPPVHSKWQFKSIFNYCFTDRDLYFVVDQVGIPGDKPARITVPGSPIWIGGSLRNCLYLLHHFPGGSCIGEDYHLSQGG